jgi:hypothetical protein
MGIRRRSPPAERGPSHRPLKQAASPKGKMEAPRSCLAPPAVTFPLPMTRPRSSIVAGPPPAGSQFSDPAMDRIERRGSKLVTKPGAEVSAHRKPLPSACEMSRLFNMLQFGARIGNESSMLGFSRSWLLEPSRGCDAGRRDLQSIRDRV